ncbi:MAG: hypothetical protein ACOYB7_08320 [Mycobacterium sp.]
MKKKFKAYPSCKGLAGWAVREIAAAESPKVMWRTDFVTIGIGRTAAPRFGAT